MERSFGSGLPRLRDQHKFACKHIIVAIIYITLDCLLAMDMAASASFTEENVETTTESIYGNLTTIKAIRSMSDDDFNDLMGVYIEPPEVTADSDEEPFEEEIVGADRRRDENTRYEKLSKQHYETYAEIVFVNHKRVISAGPEDEKPESRRNGHLLWKALALEEVKSSFTEPNYAAYKNKTPVQIFEQFFDIEIINYIIGETSKYAAQKGSHIPTLTPTELKKFVGILLLSGIRGTSKEFDCWETNTLTRCDIFVRAMPRDRFVEICNFIHFADNTKKDESDKMWKLRPLMNLFKKRFVDMCQPEEHLTFGEYMADTCRRHNDFRWCDVPIGYKIWCLNGSRGYLINFDIFQRKNSNALKYETKFGVPGAALVRILDDLPKNSFRLRFSIYFNQIFTSMDLLIALKQRGYDGTGSFKDSEIPEKCPLPSSKDMKLRNRGACEHYSCTDKDVIIVRMMDESVVTVGSTRHGLEPVEAVANEKEKNGDLYPSIIANYRKFKKGTTRMDEALCKYGIRTEGKKWYWPLFTWLLDVAVYNSFILKKNSDNNITHLKFRKAIIKAYLE